MGSDLFMEQQSWRPRPHLVEWHGEQIAVFKDEFMSGYREVYRGPLDDSVRNLLNGLGVVVPAKPAPSSAVLVRDFVAEVMPNCGGAPMLAMTPHGTYRFEVESFSVADDGVVLHLRPLPEG